METKQYKTNVMCDSCITKVTPALNEHFGEGNWNIDIKNPKKILTVSTNGEDVNNAINVLGKVGYKAENLN